MTFYCVTCFYIHALAAHICPYMHVVLLSHHVTFSHPACRCISGTRVVPRGKVQSVAGLSFVGYGAHHADYPHVYLTAAAAIGTTREEVDEFAARLSKAYEEFASKKPK